MKASQLEKQNPYITMGKQTAQIWTLSRLGLTRCWKIEAGVMSRLLKIDNPGC